MRCMAANPSSRTRKQGCCCHGLRRFIQQGSAKDLFFKRTYAGGLHPPASCLLPPVCAAAPAGLHACVHEAFAKGSGACLQIRAPSYHPFDTLRPSPHTLLRPSPLSPFNCSGRTFPICRPSCSVNRNTNRAPLQRRQRDLLHAQTVRRAPAALVAAASLRP